MLNSADRGTERINVATCPQNIGCGRMFTSDEAIGIALPS